MIRLKKSVAIICAVLMMAATGVVVAQGFDPPEGLCCQKDLETCDHPEFGEFEDSIWKTGVNTCTE